MKNKATDKPTKQYLYDEENLLVVPLEYSEVKEVRLQQPKGKHIKAIQRQARLADDLNDITMVQIAVNVLSQPTVTIEDMDEMDASDMLLLGEALGQFEFFQRLSGKV